MVMPFSGLSFRKQKGNHPVSFIPPATMNYKYCNVRHINCFAVGTAMCHLCRRGARMAADFCQVSESFHIICREEGFLFTRRYVSSSILMNITDGPLVFWNWKVSSVGNSLRITWASNTVWELWVLHAVFCFLSVHEITQWGIAKSHKSTKSLPCPLYCMTRWTGPSSCFTH